MCVAQFMSPRLAVSNLESDADGSLWFLFVQWALFYPQKCHDVFSTGQLIPLLLITSNFYTD